MGIQGKLSCSETGHCVVPKYDIDNLCHSPMRQRVGPKQDIMSFPNRTLGLSQTGHGVIHKHNNCRSHTRNFRRPKTRKDSFDLNNFGMDLIATALSIISDIFALPRSFSRKLSFVSKGSRKVRKIGSFSHLLDIFLLIIPICVRR